VRRLELGHPRTELRRDLVGLVLRGEKTATACLHGEYRPEAGHPLPKVGDESELSGFEDEPVGVVRTTEVAVVRAGDVDLRFAREEGEGFETVAAWRAAHEQFWEGENISDDTLIVCQRFALVERRGN
jgi:uncharacterized protein YhfF